MVQVKRSFHDLNVDGKNVRLRVFVPENGHAEKKPAIVMVCGLLWLGGGFLGQIGLTFNDGFAYAFARNGVACVQVHTPIRHTSHTRMMELLCMLLWPLTMVPNLCYVLMLGDVLMMATTPLDLCFLLCVPIFPSFLGGFLSLPALHLLIRIGQWLQGDIPWPKHRSALREIAATSAWAQKNTDLLGSDGRLVLCGYSSGGHCAALHAFSADSPGYESVVLISGIYDLRTQAWTGLRRYLAPVFNLMYQDAFGVCDESARAAASPAAVVPHMMQGEWYVLKAKMELLGLAPFEDILFDRGPLCKSLERAGVKVHQVTCGHNHWLLILAIESFVGPFCKSLGAPQKPTNGTKRK